MIPPHVLFLCIPLLKKHMLLHDLRLDLDLIRTARYGKIRLSHPDIPLDEIHHAEISYPAVHENIMQLRYSV